MIILPPELSRRPEWTLQHFRVVAFRTGNRILPAFARECFSGNAPSRARLQRAHVPGRETMQAARYMIATCGLAIALGAPALAQRASDSTGGDPIKALTGRLELERYKATLKGLTQFGDRRQGTDRNRAAVDWIERSEEHTSELQSRQYLVCR